MEQGSSVSLPWTSTNHAKGWYDQNSQNGPAYRIYPSSPAPWSRKYVPYRDAEVLRLAGTDFGQVVARSRWSGWTVPWPALIGRATMPPTDPPPPGSVT